MVLNMVARNGINNHLELLILSMESPAKLIDCVKSWVYKLFLYELDFEKISIEYFESCFRFLVRPYDSKKDE